MALPKGAIIAAITAGLLMCQEKGKKEENVEIPPIMSYNASLKALNDSIAGRSAEGRLEITRVKDSLTLSVNVKNLAPSIMHLMHLHGFKDTGEAQCATMEADTNGDGIVDLLETHPVSGVTLIPFNDDPAGLRIKSDTYPFADSAGNLVYSKTFSYSALREAVKQSYGIDTLAFDELVFYVHGVDTTNSLPESVQSLTEVPARVTVPVACGKVFPGVRM